MPERADGDGTRLDADAVLIGIDYGTRRIGLAVGSGRLGDARPLDTLANVNGTPDWNALDARVAEWEPAAFVIGWPLDEDGGEPPIVAHVRGFARRVGRRYERPVHRVDERYSSIAAGDRLAGRRRAGLKTRRATHADVDAEAAAVILGRWFDRHGDAGADDAAGGSGGSGASG